MKMLVRQAARRAVQSACAHRVNHGAAVQVARTLTVSAVRRNAAQAQGRDPESILGEIKTHFGEYTTAKVALLVDLVRSASQDEHLDAVKDGLTQYRERYLTMVSNVGPALVESCFRIDTETALSTLVDILGHPRQYRVFLDPPSALATMQQLLAKGRPEDVFTLFAVYQEDLYQDASAYAVLFSAGSQSEAVWPRAQQAYEYCLQHGVPLTMQGHLCMAEATLQHDKAAAVFALLDKAKKHNLADSLETVTIRARALAKAGDLLGAIGQLKAAEKLPAGTFPGSVSDVINAVVDSGDEGLAKELESAKAALRAKNHVIQ
eukprot:comp23554_c0_seq1/m.39776 comp23554_c0_seq1/g.39776  ORF comp23554_c0_seq1/g.39776 comp23554_c0_seq1/m.39776 type:complete len:320 (-) comp23554_c0_seq1:92-1051(-)